MVKRGRKENRRLETGDRIQDTGYRKRDTGYRIQVIRRTIHPNAPSTQNCIGATTIRLTAKKVIDNE
jgi:hypothetical protein